MVDSPRNYAKAHRKQGKEMVGDNQYIFTKLKSSLTNLVAFYDEITTMVGKGRANAISLRLLYTKHLTLSCMTPLPLKWRDMVLTDEHSVDKDLAG